MRALARRPATVAEVAARAAAWLVALGLVVAPLGGAAGQEPREELVEESDEVSIPDIDRLLEGEEEILGGGGYSYDPGGRRDPFRSLLETRDVERRGPRPDGVPGLLIDEVTITGIFETPRGWVVQVRASDQGKSFLLREGDDVYDGEVVSIGSNEVVFRQIVQDPTALKPFQEVVKRLNP